MLPYPAASSFFLVLPNRKVPLEALRAARQAEEAAKSRSEADEAHKAIKKQQSEARDKHQQLLYANQVGLAHRAWGHLEPKAGEGAKGAGKE